MRCPALLFAVLAGCGFEHGIGGPATSGDAMIAGGDAARDAFVPGDAPPCFQGGLIDVCLTAPMTTITLTNEAIDTDTDPRCIAGETEGCVIGARVLVVTGTVTAHGTRPLVLTAERTIDVTGTLDLSSAQGGLTGAGANPTACTTAGAGTDGSGGASGGAGGSFGGKGGDGALGDNNGAQLPGGLAGATQTVTTVRGGCPGAKGGNGSGAGGAGGNGGGAVYLAAGISITIAQTGAVFASGAGGAGGLVYEAAGGGGGTGGLVGLDAPTVTVTGIVAANGGGGGGGTGISGSTNGGNGGDGTRTLFAQLATGGTAGRYDAGSGGSGTGGATVAGQTPSSAAGGSGGGGGGAGVVWLRGVATGTQVSPAPSQH